MSQPPKLDDPPSKAEEASPTPPDDNDANDLPNDLSTLSLSPSTSHPSPPSSLLPSFTLEAIASLITSGRARRILVLTGAGISVSCGIPDFRTPGTGLYSNLQRFNLPDPQAIFTLSYYRRNPHPFIALARELYPSLFTPSPTHHFLTLLHSKGLLLRAYTQNIDGLEYLAELPHAKLVQAHGGFHSSHCIDCDATVPAEVNKADIMEGRLTRCRECGGLVKPRIVFFGEALPHAFHAGIVEDFPRCDLLICMGTSLTVQPFASLIDRVPASTPRLLINREAVGKGGPDDYDSDDEEEESAMLAQILERLPSPPSPRTVQRLRERLRAMQGGSGFRYHLKSNVRDVFVESDCDSAVRRLAALCGWADELEQRVRNGYRGGGGPREGEEVEGKGGEKVAEEVRKAGEEEREEREKHKEAKSAEKDEEGPAREADKPQAADPAPAATEAETAKL